MDLLNQYPYITLPLTALGALFVLVCICFLLYLLYHMVRGFFIACSFMRWSFKVMKANGRKPIWKKFFPTLMSAWWRHIGHDGSLTISSGASVFRGWGNYSVVKQGRFVDDVKLDNVESDDLEDDDEDLDLPESSFQKHVTENDMPDIDEIPANVRASRNVQFEPIKNRWPRPSNATKKKR